jgi:hypothetical protein
VRRTEAGNGEGVWDRLATRKFGRATSSPPGIASLLSIALDRLGVSETDFEPVQLP